VLLRLLYEVVIVPMLTAKSFIKAVAVTFMDMEFEKNGLDEIIQRLSGLVLIPEISRHLFPYNIL
jgi:hypothetical protein